MGSDVTYIVENSQTGDIYPIKSKSPEAAIELVADGLGSPSGLEVTGWIMMNKTTNKATIKKDAIAYVEELVGDIGDSILMKSCVKVAEYVIGRERGLGKK